MVHNIQGKIPFDEMVNLDNVKETDSIRVKWQLEDVKSSLINSRKISVKALVMLVCEAWHQKEEDVPVGVAINEAVEIAKCFGGETSGSFVNGVLGKIASGRKDDAEEHKAPVRKEHRAKHIIINKADKEKKQTADTAAEVE